MKHAVRALLVLSCVLGHVALGVAILSALTFDAAEARERDP